jgi:sporulation protein YlmC with PRC-barrel domain
MPALAATGDGSTPSPSSSPPSASITEQPQGVGQFHAFNASDLIGKTVKDQKGQTLGEVRDVVIGSNGKADFVILSYGGFIDRNQKYAPVPYQTFMSSLSNNSTKINTATELTANLDKAKLDKAPTFSDKNWDNMKASQGKICSYFGPGQCPGLFLQGQKS